MRKIQVTNRIATECKGRKTSQRQVAFAAGFDPSAMSDIATGKREPLVGTALKIAAALGCSVEELFALGDEGGA